MFDLEDYQEDDMAECFWRESEDLRELMTPEERAADDRYLQDRQEPDPFGE